MAIKTEKINLNQIAIAKEVFLSLIKWFLLVLVVNNLVWAAVHFGYVYKSFEGETSATIEASQTNQNGDNTITQGDK